MSGSRGSFGRTGKADYDLPAADPDREAEQIARLQELAANADVDPEFAKKFIRFIIDEVIRHHRLQKNSKQQGIKE